MKYAIVTSNSDGGLHPTKQPIGVSSVTECIACVQGRDPLTFSSCRPFSLFFWGGGGIGGEFYGPNYLKC